MIELRTTHFILATMLVFLSAALDSSEVISQEVVVKSLPLDDARWAKYGQYRPTQNWRQPDGTYLYVASPLRKGKPLLSVDPNENDLRYLPTYEPDVAHFGSNGQYSHVIRDSVLYTVIGLTSRGEYWPFDYRLSGIDLRTNKETLFEMPLYGSITASQDLVVLFTEDSLCIIDRDHNHKLVQLDVTEPADFSMPVFFLFSEGQHHLIYVQHEQNFVISHDAGESWSKDSLLLDEQIIDATRDHATGRWYCLTTEAVYEVDSNFTFSRVDFVDGAENYDLIWVHNGTMVLRETYRALPQNYTVHWIGHESEPDTLTIDGIGGWDDVMFSSNGDRIVLGQMVSRQGETLLGYTRDGLSDTTVIDRSTVLDQVVRTGSGRFLSGAARTGLRFSVGGVNWYPAWGDSIQGIADLSAHGDHVLVLDTEGKLWASTDAGESFNWMKSQFTKHDQIEWLTADEFVAVNGKWFEILGVESGKYTFSSVPQDIRTLATREPDHVVVLTDSGSIFEIIGDRIDSLSQHGLEYYPTTVAYDATGNLWVSTRFGGPYRYSNESATWFPKRLNALMGQQRADLLASTLDGNLVAYQSGQRVTNSRIWNEAEDRWMAIVDTNRNLIKYTSSTSGGGPYYRYSMFDNEYLFGDRAYHSPSWPGKSMGWETHHEVERFVGLEPARATLITTRPSYGPLVLTGDGSHTFDKELRLPTEQMVYDDKPVTVSDDGHRLFTIGKFKWSLVWYDTRTGQSDSIVIEDFEQKNTIEDVTLTGGDTVVLTSKSALENNEYFYRLWRGLNSQSSIGSVRLPKVDQTWMLNLANGLSGFVVARGIEGDEPEVAIDIVREARTPKQITIEVEDETQTSVSVSDAIIAVLYTPAGDLSQSRLETFDLDGQRLQQRSFTNTMTQLPALVHFIADTRFLLLQNDSISILDPATLETMESIPSQGVQLNNPVSYQNWVLGTQYGELLRWSPQGVVLTVDDAVSTSANSTWSVVRKGTELFIHDETRDHGTSYKLVTVNGVTVWQGATSHINMSGLASGAYVVVRLDNSDNSVTTKTVMLIR